MASITAGTNLDRYQILSLLGTGGMGEVYLAQDQRLGRKVALKLLPAHYTRDRERLRRFEQEAQAASALNHPNIITIYEIGRWEEFQYIASEYIEGTTLRRRMRAARLSPHDALDVGIQVASALVAAHTAGIVHRDIKPENIMIRPDGYVKVLDFGLAKLVEQSESETTEELDSGSNVPGSFTIVISPGDDLSMHETRPEAPPGEIPLDAYETTPLNSLGRTAPGVVWGTIQYMSPEQARGAKVDARTDIFSLGVVLYEMLTGLQPFTGQNRQEIYNAILTAEPAPVSQYLTGIPDVLEFIMAKALTKDRDDRYQTAKELLTDLRRLKRRMDLEADLTRGRTYSTTGIVPMRYQTLITPLDTASMSPAQTGAFTAQTTSPFTARLKMLGRRPGLLALILLTIIGAGGGIYAALNYLRGERRPPFSATKVSRFTTTGTALRAAISPDGKYVVYSINEGGRQSLWVRLTATTSNVEIVPPAEVFFRGLTFSHDGNYIYYIVQEGDNPIQILYQVPALGGPPRRLLVDIDSPITFSPDQTRFAFVRRHRGQGEDQLLIADADGTNERQLAVRKGTDFFGLNGPAWSPDGKVIAIAAGSNIGGRHMKLHEVRLEDGAEKPISEMRWSTVGRVVWAHDSLMINAIQQGGTVAQIWSVSRSRGEAHRLTNDLNDYRDLSLTADARAMVTIQSEAHVNVWVAPRQDLGAARQITSGIGQYNGVRGLTWLPDGRIVFVSRISTSQDIWVMNPDGSGQKQLTTPETRADVYPAVTSDGRSIIFVSNKNGSSNIYRIDPEGRDFRQLTSGTGEEFLDVSPDDKWIVFTATGSSNFTLWRVPLEGGEPEKLTDHLSQWPAISPDGKQIACWYREELNLPWRLALLPFEGGAPERVFAVPPTAPSSIPPRWFPDGSGLCYVDTREGVSNIWFQSLAGGEPRQLTGFTTDLIFWFSWSRDGRQLSVSRGRETSDVVLFTDSL